MAVDKERSPVAHESAGVDYSSMDPLKRHAQKRASDTSENLLRFVITQHTQG